MSAAQKLTGYAILSVLGLIAFWLLIKGVNVERWQQRALE